MAIVCEDCEQGTEVHFTSEQLTSMARMAGEGPQVGGYMRPLGYGLMAFRRWVEVTDSAGDAAAGTGYLTAIINAAGKTIHETKKGI